MNINWYPGHMKKTIESLKSVRAQCDIAIVLLDARIPISSYNPLLDETLSDFPVLYLLNKSDLADPKVTEDWINYFKRQKDTSAIAWSATQKANKALLTRALEDLAKEMRQRDRDKGMRKRKLRIMVTGIPNVGKSTFINQISGRKSTAIGNKPGVTKTNQWIRYHADFDLLDTPGVLWPKLDPPIRGRHLAFTGSIKDDIMDTETLALELVKEARANFFDAISTRYDLEEDPGEDLAVMDAIGRRRGALMRGGEIDYTKVSHIILDEFRTGKWGRISLEHVDDRSDL
ncbi:MAG: ribosome biogenesis GTPase YlqF [Peptoniphilus sp.]|nr:ribosome biogenesis GTPase YlqF [Peptoniphilus sp.]MDD7362908.1 ribosome biogenesis GTPase YlqF [Bacillota bacterium]MDY6044148.1 ribosome biogenesis GTPase YlqF [Peptoniphilus sp.]